MSIFGKKIQETNLLTGEVRVNGHVINRTFQHYFPPEKQEYQSPRISAVEIPPSCSGGHGHARYDRLLGHIQTVPGHTATMADLSKESADHARKFDKFLDDISG